jgi:hypothetical protein
MSVVGYRHPQVNNLDRLPYLNPLQKKGLPAMLLLDHE